MEININKKDPKLEIVQDLIGNHKYSIIKKERKKNEKITFC